MKVAIVVAMVAAATLHPGKERWAVKLMPSVGPNAEEVVRAAATNYGPAFAVDLPDLMHLSAPERDPRYETERVQLWADRDLREGSRIVTSGYLALAALEPDGDYHLQLTMEPGAGPCVIVEIPHPLFIEDADLKEQATVSRMVVRGVLSHHDPSKKGTLLRPPPKVCVLGALFFDLSHEELDGGVQPRGKRGMSAPSVAEIHPVEAIWIDDGQGCAEKR